MLNKIILFLILISVTSFSQIKLPRLISDGMVIQRNMENKIWGWGEPGEKISINFNEKSFSTIVNENGSWNIILPELNAGGPYEMKISSENSDTTIKDIMIGDVWICSGQSNMEINMKRVSPLYQSEIENSEHNYIRYFEVPDRYNFNKPLNDFESGSWQKPDPKTVLNFSAVCYFFGKELYEKYKIPIGLINSALGGSPAESWISEEGLKIFPDHYNEALMFKDSSLIQKIQNEDKARIEAWYKELWEKDEGYHNSNQNWFNPEYNSSEWDVMKIPGYWADNFPGLINGVFWFRKEFHIPDSKSGKEAQLLLGRIIDADSVFVNNVFVGSTGYQYPPRRYTIPPGVLKDGKNLIAVRIINTNGKGGFAEDKPYEIIIDDFKVDLKGEWKFKPGAKMEPLRGETFIRWKPMGLYNAMIAPLTNLSIKGVIWYQGESNADRYKEYQELFPALINDWRKNWGQGDFPFIYVQLPNFMEAQPEPSEHTWAYMRESQLKSLSVPNTGMAVTIDIGEWNDIHPLNKKDVGIRLSLAAQKVAYGEDIVYSGPIYESMSIEKNKIILSFSSIGSGLVAKGDGELKEFAIAGSDRKFVWANAEIQGDKVVVWNDSIENPVAVRYAWAGNPENANLYNKEDLPASPFRTDDWDSFKIQN